MSINCSVAIWHNKSRLVILSIYTAAQSIFETPFSSHVTTTNKVFYLESIGGHIVRIPLLRLNISMWVFMSLLETYIWWKGKAGALTALLRTALQVWLFPHQGFSGGGMFWQVK